MPHFDTAFVDAMVHATKLIFIGIERCVYLVVVHTKSINVDAAFVQLCICWTLSILPFTLEVLDHGYALHGAILRISDVKVIITNYSM